MIHKVNLTRLLQQISLYCVSVLYQHPIFTVSMDAECTVLLKTFKLTQDRRKHVYIKKAGTVFPG